MSRTALFGAALLLCATILVITVYEKFAQGGWITLVITCLVIALCFTIRRHYRSVTLELDQLYRELGDVPLTPRPAKAAPPGIDPRGPTAAVLVGSYGGVGIHTVLNIFRVFPGHFKNLVFVSVGVIDSGEFKGEHGVEDLRRRTQEMQEKYVSLAASLSVPATARMTVGTEAVEEG